jgi:hypothetical protein
VEAEGLAADKKTPLDVAPISSSSMRADSCSARMSAGRGTSRADPLHSPPLSPACAKACRARCGPPRACSAARRRTGGPICSTASRRASRRSESRLVPTTPFAGIGADPELAALFDEAMADSTKHALRAAPRERRTPLPGRGAAGASQHGAG